MSLLVVLTTKGIARLLEVCLKTSIFQRRLVISISNQFHKYFAIIFWKNCSSRVNEEKANTFHFHDPFSTADHKLLVSTCMIEGAVKGIHWNGKALELSFDTFMDAHTFTSLSAREAGVQPCLILPRLGLAQLAAYHQPDVSPKMSGWIVPSSSTRLLLEVFMNRRFWTRGMLVTHSSPK